MLLHWIMVPISTWMFTESYYEWWLLVTGHLNADMFMHLNAKCLHVFCSSYLANHKFNGKRVGQNCCFLTNTFQENCCNFSFDIAQCSCNDCCKTVSLMPAWIWTMVYNLQLCHCSSINLSGYRIRTITTDLITEKHNMFITTLQTVC
jgi:hypothetical protein